MSSEHSDEMRAIDKMFKTKLTTEATIAEDSNIDRPSQRRRSTVKGVTFSMAEHHGEKPTREKYLPSDASVHSLRIERDNESYVILPWSKGYKCT